jgi:hypothetical protein
MMDFNIPVIVDNYGGAGNTTEEKSQPPQYILKDEDGNEVTFYSMLEMSLASGSQIPTEPIEKGSFANYNRIIEPFEASCRLALEGTDSDIQTALQGLEELKKGLKKIEFIMPFETYENLMLVSYDYRRDEHSGFNLLQVDLKLKEVREVESAKTTSSVEEPPQVTQQASADASCVSTEDGGQYQTYSPTAGESQTAENPPKEETTLAYDIKKGLGW